MASTSLVSQLSTPHLSSICRSYKKCSLNVNSCHTNYLNRRITILGATASTLLAQEAMLGECRLALGLELRMTVPDQTVEEAESGIRDHARALLRVKALIESEDWREMQQELRRKSSLLKQDIYTIIQSKPGTMRPLLRKLYFNLFNSVTKLDYAARDQDVARVLDYYENISTTLGEILSQILS